MQNDVDEFHEILKKNPEKAVNSVLLHLHKIENQKLGISLLVIFKQYKRHIVTGRCTRKVPTTTVPRKKTVIYMAMQIQGERHFFKEAKKCAET